MKNDDRDPDWWRICNSPMVQGLHRIVTLVGVPIVVALFLWIGSTFDQMRTELAQLRTTISIILPAMKEGQRDLRFRVRRLEFVDRQHGPPAPGRH
jgi:hypothetical protein